MSQKKDVPISMVAGAVFVLYLLISWLPIRGISLGSLLTLVGIAAIAFALFTGRRDIVICAGFTLLALIQVVSFFHGFSGMAYRVEIWHYKADNETPFNLLCMLPALALLVGSVGAALLSVVELTDYIPQYKEWTKKLWFVPAVCIIASVVIALLVFLLDIIGLIRGSWYGATAYIGFKGFILTVVKAAAVLLASMWIVYPDGVPSLEKSGNVTYGSSVVIDNKMYCGLVKHAVLLAVTCGVWLCIWIYRMTGYTNGVEGEEDRNPTTKLLLCIFAPFYTTYWTYKTALRIDAMAKERGVSSNMTMLCTVMSLVAPFISPILLQDKLNSIVAHDPDAQNAETASGVVLNDRMHCGLVKHAVLLAVTCGIWLYIWVYRMTGYTNGVKGEEDRNPTTKLLLSIFVPLYIVYWMHKTALRIDAMAEECGVASDLTQVCTILSPVAPIIPPILLQDKLNSLLANK